MVTSQYSHILQDSFDAWKGTECGKMWSAEYSDWHQVTSSQDAHSVGLYIAQHSWQHQSVSKSVLTAYSLTTSVLQYNLLLLRSYIHQSQLPSRWLRCPTMPAESNNRLLCVFENASHKKFNNQIFDYCLTSLVRCIVNTLINVHCWR